MTLNPVWYRLSIDLTPGLNVLGTSVEQRDDNGVITLLVNSQPGPFDTADEALNGLIQLVLFYFGEQLTLPL